MGIFDGIESFAKTTIGGVVLTLLFTTCIGGFVTYEFAALQARENLAAEQRKVAAVNRAELVNNLTKLLSERKTYAGLVISAIRYKAKPEELKARWDTYQAAYVEYNTALYKYRSTTGLLMGLDIGEKLNRPFKDYITPAFARIDTCLTAAYYSYTIGGNPDAGKIFDDCRAHRNGVEVSFRIKDEMGGLQSCLATYDEILMRSIFIENEYDKIPHGETRSLPAEPTVSSSKGADVDLKCRSDDFLCQRIETAGNIQQQIAGGCGPLARIGIPVKSAVASGAGGTSDDAQP